MVRNYLLTAFRNIIRHKGFTFLNVLGLSLSMAVCMLIIVILVDQYAYDKQHLEKHQIYRIQSIDNKSEFSLNRYASTAYPLADELSNNFPFIEEAVMVKNSLRGDGVYNGNRIALNGLYTDDSFFRVFNFTLKGGYQNAILDEPFKIILQEEICSQVFRG